MANGLESVIRNIVKKVLRTEYPHVADPSILTAKVTKQEERGEYYLYAVVVLDLDGNRDQAYPEIPRIKSRQGYKIGDRVVIIMIRGRDAYLVGEVV